VVVDDVRVFCAENAVNVAKKKIENYIMEKPIILLFGMPRSGTTWIGKIFDSHPDVLYRHEPDSWIRIEGMPVLAPDKNTDAIYNLAKDYVNKLESIRLPQVTSKLPLFEKNYSSFIRGKMYEASALLSSAVGKVGGTIKLLTINPVSANKSITSFLSSVIVCESSIAVTVVRDAIISPKNIIPKISNFFIFLPRIFCYLSNVNRQHSL